MTASQAAVVIICDAGSRSGLGHLTRALVSAKTLRRHLSKEVTLIIRGDAIQFPGLDAFETKWVEEFSSKRHVLAAADIVIVDVAVLDPEIKDMLSQLPRRVLTVGIDVHSADAYLFKLVWMPCLSIPNEELAMYGGDLFFGPECFLLRPSPVNVFSEKPSNGVPRKKVIALTGGSDPTCLNRSLPAALDNTLPPEVEIHWVTGPYANAPWLARLVGRERWTVLKSPPNLPDLLPGYQAALCVYGLSFYECLQAGVPPVTFDAVGAATAHEWKDLRSRLFCCVADNVSEALNKLDSGLRTGFNLEEISRLQLSLRQGPAHFAARVKARLDECSRG